MTPFYCKDKLAGERDRNNNPVLSLAANLIIHFLSHACHIVETTTSILDRADTKPQYER